MKSAENISSLTVVGFLGVTLDRGTGPKRWEHWRPTVSLAQHEDVLMDRLVLLYPPKYQRLAEQVKQDVTRLSPSTAVDLTPIAVKDPWDFEEMYAALHDFAHNFEPGDGELWVHITTGTHVAQICLFLLTESRFLPGKLLQTQPGKSSDKGTGAFQLIDLELARYDRIATRFEEEREKATGRLKAGIATKNQRFNSLIDRVERVTIASDAPILLTGPTGAGKSQLARRIYDLKRERGQVRGPLVQVNCATLRGDQAMSALFGHRRGAFTGAVTDRPGLLSRADGGLLFLDEIGELGADEQAMLLLAVEEHRFIPIGADREVTSHFQLIAGSNRDLQEAVQQGRFRADLLARINLWTFALPPLRDRPEDIAPNVGYELERFARDAGRRVRFNKEARQRFLGWAQSEATWDGNFRDLGAAITRMATLAPSGRIGLRDVNEEITRLQSAWQPAAQSAFPRLDALLGARVEELDHFDRVQLEEVLRVCRQSRSLAEAGRRLFAVSRTQRKTANDADRLRKYLGRFGLGREDVLPS